MLGCSGSPPRRGAPLGTRATPEGAASEHTADGAAVTRININHEE